MIRRALTNTGWLMGARGVNAVLSLGYLAMATRSLGLEGFGQFVLCITFGQVLVGLVTFQTWQVVVHWGHQEGKLADATGFAIALDMLTIILGATLAISVITLAGDWLPIPDRLRPEALAFALAAVVSIRSTPTGILRLHDRYNLAAVADAATSIVRVIGAAVVLFVDPTIDGFIIVWGVAEVATAATYWFLASTTQPIFWRHISLVRIPRNEDRAWPFVIGTSLSGLLAIASRQFLVLLVGTIGGPALAGIYRVAAQIGEGLLKLAQALLRATYPELVRSPTEARRMAGKIALIGVVTGLATVAVSAFAGDWVIKAIAGKAYLGAYVPMIVLSAAAALELSGAALEALLIARGKAILNFGLRAVPTAAALLALPWLVGHVGAVGAAGAVFVASTLTVSGFILANKRLDMKEAAAA